MSNAIDPCRERISEECSSRTKSTRNGVFAMAIAVVVLAASAIIAQRPQKLERPIKIGSKNSLLHLGSLDSFDRTELGTTAAKRIKDCVEKGRIDAAREAWKIYEEIIPNENFGGEYTALQWLCEYLSSSPARQKEMADPPFVAGFVNYWSRNKWEPLRTYLKFKYKLDGAMLKTRDENDLQRFHEDFILFANPNRQKWEKTSAFIKTINLKEGQTVADIGSGPGYFTFKFSKIVGDKGKVYAIDTNERHIDYLKDMIKKIPGAGNVEPRVPVQKENDIGIPKDVKVDVVFTCSLYHIIYIAFTDEERQTFVDAIKRGLKPDGRLIVVDNGLVDPEKNGRRLPYHGPYIAKELIIAQLEQFGFELAEPVHQIIKQRYMLVFKLADPNKARVPLIAAPGDLVVNSTSSLVHHRRIGNPFEFTLKGRAAAKVFREALEAKDDKAAKKFAEEALKLYVGLSNPETGERIGNEYLAFAWYCKYILAAPRDRKAMLADPLVNDYFTTLGGDNFTIVKRFIRAFYVLDTKDEDIDDPAKVVETKESFDDIFEWMEKIIFNSPVRPDWEKTEQTMKLLNLKPGQTIADVGCGGGFYTFRFSDKVGPSGKVFALETNKDALAEFMKSTERLGRKNIEGIKSTYDNCHLPPESVDVLFLCSLYESAYVTSIDFVQDRFVKSMKAALKDGGRLVIIDNEIDTGKFPSYFGPRIDRRLIIEQLKRFGWKVVEQKNFIPQRYILIFETGPRTWFEKRADDIIY